LVPLVDRFSTIVRAQLQENPVLEFPQDRMAQMELILDLFVKQSSRKALQDFPFARRQRTGPVCLRRVLGGRTRRDDSRVGGSPHRLEAARNEAHGRETLSQRERLDQVATDARCEGPLDEPSISQRRGDNDPQPRPRGQELPGALDAAKARQLQVDERKIGIQRRRFVEDSRRGAEEAAVAELFNAVADPPQDCANPRVVAHERNPNGSLPLPISRRDGGLGKKPASTQIAKLPASRTIPTSAADGAEPWHHKIARPFTT
jgi:hypothetical protein